MVRWRRDQPDARHRVAQVTDVLRDFVARQLATLAGFGALRHLDLNLVGRHQIFGRYAEPPRSDLLDLGPQGVTFLQLVVRRRLNAALAQQVAQAGARLDALALQLTPVACRILAAFSGVRLPADAVHGDRQGGMGLGADRAERHRTGGEPLDDLGSRLHLIEWNRLFGIHLQLKEAAQGHVAARLVIDEAGVFAVRLEAARARGVLELGDGVRRPHMLFALGAPGVLAAHVKVAGELGIISESRAVEAQCLFGHLKDADAAHLGRGAAEVLVHQLLAQPDGLENLRTAVGHVGADAHLRHDLRQALADALDVVADGLFGLFWKQLLQRLQGEVRMNGLGAVARQHRKVVDLAGRTGFHHQAGRGAQTLANEVLMNRRQGKRRRNSDVIAVHPPVGENQDIVVAADRVDGLRAQRSETGFDALTAPGRRIADVQLIGPEFATRLLTDRAQPRHICKIENRLRDLQPHGRIDRVDIEEVRLGPDKGHQRHHNLFANRVDGRVGDLRKQLAEIVVEKLVLAREHRQGRVVAHRANALLTRSGQGIQQELEIFLGVPKGLLAVKQRRIEGRG